MLLNIFSLSFHSVWTSFFRDSRSTSVFCIPRMCVAESQFSFSCAHFQIYLDKVSHFPERLVPNLFIQAAAVSHNIFCELIVRDGLGVLSQTVLLEVLRHWCDFVFNHLRRVPLSSLNTLLLSSHLKSHRFLFLLRSWEQ